MIENHLVTSITNSVVYEKPFTHLIFSACFPMEVYSEMTVRLPPRDIYGTGPNERRMLELCFKNFNHPKFPYPFFWRGIEEALKGPALQEILFKLLGSDLAFRWGDKVTPVIPQVFLASDNPGYFIEPHTDILTKVLTAQFYLPVDDTQWDLGTDILSDADTFVRRLDFLPNTGYSFAVTKKSWHGRPMTSHKGKVRNSLILIYYVEGKEGPGPQYPASGFDLK